MSTKNKEEKISPSIQKIIDETKQDFDVISVQPRFGFFSIPPNQIIGDRYYSTKKEFNHKVVDRKVISEKRGIFTTIGKSGKGHDAYFQSLDTTDEGVQQRLIDGWKKDEKKHQYLNILGYNIIKMNLIKIRLKELNLFIKISQE